ncbi:hypothetical protein Fcan01_17949 [Folsomia candida]|uniref:Uncharacterized protein n=1 Tax=Folsomia candida TaxID=158441 RepID=A0A226DQM2_FOLCA|nr:hypothetical protein Fcan01_17949 [Folsomia candida]
MSSTFFFHLIFFGGVLQSCKADEGVEFGDGNVTKSIINHHTCISSKSDTKLSNQSTKDDIAELAKTMQNEIAKLSKKLELLQSNVQYLISSTENNNADGQQIGNRRTRRFFKFLQSKVPDYVASDYRLGILISEIKKTSLNESCNFVDKLLAVEKDQFAVLEDIQHTTSKILRTVRFLEFKS